MDDKCFLKKIDEFNYLQGWSHLMINYNGTNDCKYIQIEVAARDGDLLIFISVIGHSC